MNNSLKLLEVWRKENGLSKTAMSRLMGAPSSQYYTNWLARDSLPKEYYSVASAILGTETPEKARSAIRSAGKPGHRTTKAIGDNDDITALLSQLGDKAKLEAFSAICRQLSPADSLRLASILIAHVADDL